MKYYSFIQSDLGEWLLFAQAETKDDAKEAISPLLNAGFPKERTKIVNTNQTTEADAYVTLQFTTFDGDIYDYPIHTNNPRREYLLAVELALTKALTDISCVVMTDNRNIELYRFEFGDIYQRTKAHKFNDHDRLLTTSSRHYSERNQIHKVPA